MTYTVDSRPADRRNYNKRPGGRKPSGIIPHHWGVDGQDHDNVAAYLGQYRPANPTSAHDVISADRVTEVVKWAYRAWHGRSANNDYIGLECRPEMSAGDWQTLVERCADIERYYNKSMRYANHSDFVSTACPGRYTSRLGELINAVNAELANAGTPVKPTKTKPRKGQSRKTVAEMADEVIAGQHGNGHTARQHSLGITASKYKKVRAEVNKRSGVSSPKASSSAIERMANEVLAGKHGNGHAQRRRSLGVSKADYQKVRDVVNGRSGVSGGKSVATMAREVIQGRHGNGHAERRASLGISKSLYKKVRQEVNRRA